jgi:hypothetical protein
MLRPNQLCMAIVRAFIIAAVFCFVQTASAQTCAPPPAGLVDFWPGDRSANDFIGANHGTLTNGATFLDSGKVGPAFTFDGTDDYVAIPSINSGPNFTVEFWFYPTRTAGNEELLGNNISSGNFGVLYFVNNHIEYWQGGGPKASTPNSIPLSVWTHVALVYDANTQRAQLYLNGAASGSPSAMHSEIFNNPLRFGDAVINASSNFKGALDEVSLFNTALTPANVSSIFVAGDKGKCAAPALIVNDASVLEGDGGTTNISFTVSLLRAAAPAQVSYATADGTATQPGDYLATSGTTTVPVSGSATVTVLVNGDTTLEPNETFFLNLSNPVNAVIADGQAIGTIFSDDCTAPPSGIADWYKAEGNALDSIGTNHATLENGATFAVGNSGQAFSLDGADDFVNVASTVNLGSAYTVELWVYPTSASYQNLVSNNQSGVTYGNLYFDGSSGRLEYVQAGGLKTNSSGIIPLNAWSHVALTYDGAVSRLYVNGAASGTPSGIHAETFNNPLRFGFSVDSSGSRFQGRLDEISLYSRALSAAEIQAIFVAGGGGKCGGAVANTWTGTVSSDWHSAGNWSGGVVPTSTADVAIPAIGVTNEPMISSADVTVNTLNINANRTLAVAGGRTLTVTNDLINDATLAGAGTVVELAAVNNSGTISLSSFNFSRAGAQTLLGSGSFSNNVATVMNGSILTLLSNHQFSSLVVQASATLDISSRTLSVSGNLTNSGAITTTGSTVVANGTTSQILTNANYRNLTAQNSAGVALGSNATVTHILTLTSDLQTGGFILTMPWGTETSAGGGDVVGNIRIIGLASPAASYGNPFNTIGFSSGTPPTDVTVNLVKAAPGGFPNAVQRTYTVTPNGGVGFAANVQLHYLDSELNGNAEGAALSLWRFNGTSWQKSTNNAFSTTDNWVQTTNVTQFSPWTFNSTVPTAAPANISGQVTNADGSPLGGVLMTLTGGSISRRAISNSVGFYEFKEVDTGAFYSVRPLAANYDFAPAERSFSLLANKTDAVFTARALPVTANPLDTPEYFVRQQYLDFLGREPDESGFNFWTNQIRACGNDATCLEARKVNTSAAFFLSIEFQQTGYLVYRTYKSAYGDIAGAPIPIKLNEFLSDTNEIGQGVVVNQVDWQQLLDNNTAAFMSKFVERSRFRANYPTALTPAEFVDRLFFNAGVSPVGSERVAALAEFGSATSTSDVAARARAMRRVAENATLAQRELSRAIVLMQYFGYLRRNPVDAPESTLDYGGYNFWLDKLNRFGGNFVNAEMVKAFLVSGEYRQRFGL